MHKSILLSLNLHGSANLTSAVYNVFLFACPIPSLLPTFHILKVTKASEICTRTQISLIPCVSPEFITYLY